MIKIKTTDGDWGHACDSYGKVQHSRKACVYTVIKGKDGDRLITVAARIPNWGDARLMAAAKEMYWDKHSTACLDARLALTQGSELLRRLAQRPAPRGKPMSSKRLGLNNSGYQPVSLAPRIPPSATCQFDYTNQAWLINGKYAPCAHPPEMHCDCFGKTHQGQPARPDAEIQ